MLPVAPGFLARVADNCGAGRCDGPDVRQYLGYAGRGCGLHDRRFSVVLPMLFAKPWMVAMGYDPADKARIAEMRKGAGPKYAISFLTSLLSAFVLGKIIYHLAISTALYGMKVGLAVWAAFVMSVQLTDKLFGDRPWNLFLINTGYQSVCYLAMGAILGKWVGC